MSYASHPCYYADSQANVTSEVDDSQDGALAFAISEQTAWQLSKTSVAALGSNVIATKSGVGRWLRLAYGSEAAPVSNDYYWPYAVDGARTENGGGTAAPLTGPACYSALTISNNTSLSMASQRLICTGTLTVGTGCRLHNDGASATSNAGASGGVPAGQIAASAGPNGAAGGSVASNGIAGTAVSPGIGGSGGAGGGGSQPTTGGAGGAVTAPNPASVGLLWTQEFLAFMACISGINFTQVRGGGPGGGGGGSNGADNRAGGGGGQGGGLVWIRAKNIVVSGTGVISAKGGSGFSPAGPGAGGGGGGGGGFIVIWCDTFTGPGGANDFAGALSVAGGAGGAVSGVATAGTPGSTGKILVFVRGVLAYSVGVLPGAPRHGSMAEVKHQEIFAMVYGLAGPDPTVHMTLTPMTTRTCSCPNRWRSSGVGDLTNLDGAPTNGDMIKLIAGAGLGVLVGMWLIEHFAGHLWPGRSRTAIAVTPTVETPWRRCCARRRTLGQRAKTWPTSTTRSSLTMARSCQIASPTRWLATRR